MRPYERWGRRRHSQAGSPLVGAILGFALVVFLMMAGLSGGSFERLAKIFGFG